MDDKLAYQVLSHSLVANPTRRDIQRELFGGNNAEGNQKFYAFCIRHKSPICEHCGKPIPHPTAINVSHILTRGSHPEMAHDPRNVQMLCAGCHGLWEHTTTRSKMNPWFVEKTNKIIERLKQEYNGTE